MSSPARLRSLRLVGFKSFAEKTELEFGAGISVIVGPNGSGKSNLADALRWAMGEQGRSLRIRRAEDVIFAGSERRHGIGMADVTLVLDNHDGLLPVDFGEVSLGRRLYRSGENEYLLNRQRVRLRDIVDLLEGANLADNAFLFIGQGMVDQALALRPEERRPLFEEVAGVRRHDRRRRLAEQQLAEAEANLARVHDLLGELRPQARRLAQQVEQQRARSSAAAELARALVAAAGARWGAAAGSAREAAEVLATVRGQAAGELAGVGTAETLVVQLEGQQLRQRAAEDELRASLDTLRAEQTELRLQLVRAEGEVEALQRERRRMEEELATLERRSADAHATVATPLPEVDSEAQAALRAAERELAEGIAELARLRAAVQAAGEREAALRRAELARAADLDSARRRASQAARRLAEQEVRHAGAVETERAAAARREEAAAALQRAMEGEGLAEEAAAAARDALEAAETRQRQVASRLAGLAAEVAAARSQLAGADEALRRAAGGEIVEAALRLGGRRIADGLEVEPALRPAVAAALGEALRAPAVTTAQVTALGVARGVVVLLDVVPAQAERLRRAADAAAAAGGGALGDAIRSDPTGTVKRLLSLALWVPDLPAALRLQALLPAGSVVATPSGDLLSAGGTVSLRGADPLLERRAERGRLADDLAAREHELESLNAEAEVARRGLDTARRRAEETRLTSQQARSARRATEEADRAAARSGDAAHRDLAWERAQFERLRAEADRATAALRSLEEGQPGLWDTRAATTDSATAEGGEPAPAGGGTPTGVGGAVAEPSPAGPGMDHGNPPRTALGAWQLRVAELERRRDALAGAVDAAESARRDAENARSRAEAALALHDARIAEIGAALGTSAGALERARDARASLALRLADLDAREGRLRQELASVQAQVAEGRATLETAERDAAARRERLRAADEAVRAAELAEVEVRLARDALREQVLVELAALGPAGLDALRAVAATGSAPAAEETWGRAGLTGRDRDAERGGAPADGAVSADGTVSADGAVSADGTVFDDSAAFPRATDEEHLAQALEGALDRATEHWEQDPPPEAAPSQARLALLRRRVHELGAGNPFAAEEYEEVAGRLVTLEQQRADLEQAIATTRRLIAELSEQISRQFRATFEALEGAFERRFAGLFGGGFARLSLTEPEDIQSTGIEIVAQPPGKKRQPLAMLSGGERALTAVALLFAMLEVRPVPFCVLDEVDAALDEANVGRFADALRELAATTQIIVITHNRGTIESADALYGITLGADAVSRVVSLRLEEAAAMAERGGVDRPGAVSPA